MVLLSVYNNVFSSVIHTRKEIIKKNMQLYKYMSLIPDLSNWNGKCSVQGKRERIMIPIIGITSLKWINAPLDITFTIRWVVWMRLLNILVFIYGFLFNVIHAVLQNISSRLIFTIFLLFLFNEKIKSAKYVLSNVSLIF